MSTKPATSILLARHIAKLGQLTKSEENLISNYIQKKILVFPLDYKNSINLKAIFEVNNYKDLTKLIKICMDIPSLELHLNLNNTSEYLSIPNYPTYKYIDTIGELFKKSIYSANTSVIEGKDKLTIIVGNSSRGIQETLELLLDVKNISRYKTINISLAHLNSEQKFNNFELKNLKEFLEELNKELITNININRKIINISKLFLKWFYKSNSYRIAVTKREVETVSDYKLTVNQVKESILKGYIYNNNSLLFKLNRDILDNCSKEDILKTRKLSRKIEIIKKEWDKNRYLNNGVLLPNNSLVLTQTGPKSVDKIAKTIVNLWNGIEWVYATIHKSEDKKQEFVYLVILEDKTCFEVYENSLISKQDGSYVTAKELKKGDVLMKLNYPNNYNYIDHYMPTCGVVKEVVYNHFEEDIYSIKVNDNYSSKDIVIANSILFKANVIKENITLSEVTKVELAPRIASNYIEDNYLLAKNTIILDTIIDLTNCTITNLDDFTNAFKIASICTCTALKHPLHSEIEKFNCSLKNYPTVNVELTEIYSFIKDIKNNVIKESNNSFYCVLQLPKSEYKRHFIDSCENNGEVVKIENGGYLFKSSVKQKLVYTILIVLMNYARLIIQDTVSKYCTKHAITIPKIISSVRDNNIPKEIQSIEEQYELIKLLNSYYATHNVNMPIYYKKKNIDYMAKYLTRVINKNESTYYSEFKELEN